MDFEVNGYRMHYELYGDPNCEPLLWLHGWSGTGQDWKYIFRESASDMFALLDHLGIPRIKAIGLSGGGITLLHMATQQPDRIEAMVVVSAPPYFPEQARAIQRQFSFDLL